MSGNRRAWRKPARPWGESLQALQIGIHRKPPTMQPDGNSTHSRHNMLARITASHFYCTALIRLKHEYLQQNICKMIKWRGKALCQSTGSLPARFCRLKVDSLQSLCQIAKKQHLLGCCSERSTLLSWCPRRHGRNLNTEPVPVCNSRVFDVLYDHSWLWTINWALKWTRRVFTH